MKKMFLSFALFAFVLSGSFAQTDYVQVEVMSLTPKADKVDLFKKGLAAHNKKYHAAGPYHVSIGYVYSGPNTGNYTWYMGPTTWTQMDGRPDKGEHQLDWDKNVSPYLHAAGPVSFWRHNKEIDYQPEGVPESTKSRVRFHHVRTGQMDRFTEQMKKVMEVNKAMKSKMSFQVWTHFGFTDGPNAVTVQNFANWAALDAVGDFAQEFEKKYGMGSWDRFLEELDLCIDRSRSYEELHENQPDLGG